MRNVFAALSKYGQRAEENFLTESLVFLIQTLVERHPQEGTEFLRWLCGLADSEISESVAVSTQASVEEGRPDIEIRQDGSVLVYVEVKHDSPLSPGQLEAYASALRRSGYPKTSLVLLTRSRSASHVTTLPSRDFHHVCWYDVYGRLEQIPEKDELSSYFIRGFRAFLFEKGMAMEKVDWQYLGGVPAYLHLTNMLEAALSEAHPSVRLRKTAGWTWRGFYLPGGLWCGIRLDSHLTVLCENNNGQNPTYRRELDLQQVHFFALDQGDQFETLVQFVREAIESAPHGPDDGEGDVAWEEPQLTAEVE